MSVLSFALKKEDPQSNNSEIYEYKHFRENRRRMLPRAALVGLIAGGVASLFGYLLSLADNFRGQLLVFSHQSSYGWIFPTLYGAVGTVLSLFLVRQFAPDIPQLKAVLRRLKKMSWGKVLIVKFTSGIFALGCGLLLGKEGPMLQIGGAVGDGVSEKLKLPAKERRTMITAGIGAGLAAAFNAPLTGLSFVLEEVQHDFQPIVFATAFIASMVANIVARYFGQGELIFSIPNYATPPLTSLPFFILLGVLAGFLGVFFNKCIIGALNVSSRIGKHWIFIVAAVIGATIGLISWFSPQLAGGGYKIAESAMDGRLALKALPLLLLVRFIMTIGSYGTGVTGGIFAPLLALGALLGSIVGQIAQMCYPSAVPEPAVFAVVGMGAMFASILRAPLSGILLIIEMTGNYEQMIPLLVACFFAYDVADLLKDTPIYDALFERDLARSGTKVNLDKPAVMEFEIEDGAPFDGKEVASLGLPPGCVIIGCTKDGVEIVPTAHTCLEASMKLTLAIDSKAADSVALVVNGCRRPEQD